MNVQFAVKGGEVYVLEVNPRASRTVPFVSKATGRPLAKIAAKVMVGQHARRARRRRRGRSRATSRSRRASSRSRSSPASTPSSARRCARRARSWASPTRSRAPSARRIARQRHPDRAAAARRREAARVHQREGRGQAGGRAHRAAAPRARLRDLRDAAAPPRPSRARAFPCEVAQQGQRGHAARRRRDSKSGTIGVVVNTTIGAKEVRDSYSLRRQTLLSNIPYFTTIAAALAACDALEVTRDDDRMPVRSLQEWGG